MATKRIWFGSFGPFLFDDEKTYDGSVEVRALRMEGGLLLQATDVILGDNIDRIYFFRDDNNDTFASLFGFINSDGEHEVRLEQGATPGVTLDIIRLNPTIILETQAMLGFGKKTEAEKSLVDLTKIPNAAFLLNDDTDWLEYWNETEWVPLPKPIESAAIDDTDSPFTVTLLGKNTVITADATSGAITVNLPAVADWKNFEIVIKKLDGAANNVTINADGSETIDGSASYDLVNQYDTVTLYSDGNEALVLSSI